MVSFQSSTSNNSQGSNRWLSNIQQGSEKFGDPDNVCREDTWAFGASGHNSRQQQINEQEEERWAFIVINQIPADRREEENSYKKCKKF